MATSENESAIQAPWRVFKGMTCSATKVVAPGSCGSAEVPSQVEDLRRRYVLTEDRARRDS
jgi:hypothetical protein